MRVQDQLGQCSLHTMRAAVYPTVRFPFTSTAESFLSAVIQEEEPSDMLRLKLPGAFSMSSVRAMYRFLDVG